MSEHVLTVAEELAIAAFMLFLTVVVLVFVAPVAIIVGAVYGVTFTAAACVVELRKWRRAA